MFWNADREESTAPPFHDPQRWGTDERDAAMARAGSRVITMRAWKQKYVQTEAYELFRGERPVRCRCYNVQRTDLPR